MKNEIKTAPMHKLLKRAGAERVSEESANALGEALGNIGDMRAIDSLIEVLMCDNSSDVGHQVELALCKMGEPAIEPLAQAFKNDDREVRIRIVSALGYLFPQSLEPAGPASTATEGL